MGLRQIESRLPPGFRFYPSDEELVCHYLCKKISNERVWEGTMVEVDLHTCEPWELPDVAKLSASEWYFFSFRDRKYSTGSRTNRATRSGYWKATGKDRSVHDPETHAIVGMRKTLVFHSGRAPNGTKTSWVMHEFRLESPHMPPKEDWVLCRVFSKNKVETMTSFPGNDQQNDIGFSSPNKFLSFHPLIGLQEMPADGYDQLSTFTTIQQENNYNFTMLQHNILDFPIQEMEYSSSFTGASGLGLGDESEFLWNMIGT